MGLRRDDHWFNVDVRETSHFPFTMNLKYLKWEVGKPSSSSYMRGIIIIDGVIWLWTLVWMKMWIYNGNKSHIYINIWCNKGSRHVACVVCSKLTLWNYMYNTDMAAVYLLGITYVEVNKKFKPTCRVSILLQLCIHVEDTDNYTGFFGTKHTFLRAKLNSTCEALTTIT